MSAAPPVTDLLVLCYHAVSSSWPSPAAITPARLGAQLRFLLSRGYQPLTLSAALAEKVPRKVLVVTFDDAYTSIRTAGLPVLRRLGVPATVFVPTDMAGEGALMAWSELAQWVGSAHEQELRCMGWDELRELGRLGWQIGSHSRSHPHLTALSPETLDDELRLSRAACEEQLQLPCRALAYPFGSYDATVMEAAGAAGYEAGVTLDERVLEPLVGRGPLEIPRESVYRSTGWAVFAIKTSHLVRRVRVSAAYARF